MATKSCRPLKVLLYPSRLSTELDSIIAKLRKVTRSYKISEQS
jgi:hypothetical protein